MRASVFFAFSLAVIAAAVPARATNFAILFGGASGNSGGCDVPRNPSAAYTPAAMQFTLPASALPGPRILTIDFSPVLPSSISPLPAASYVFSLTLTDPATGQSTHDLGGDMEICFVSPNTSSTTLDKLCLGYLNENHNPPKWECEDRALYVKPGSNNTVCGTTDHLSIFALTDLAAVPEPSAAGFLLAGTLLRRRR